MRVEVRLDEKSEIGGFYEHKNVYSVKFIDGVCEIKFMIDGTSPNAIWYIMDKIVSVESYCGVNEE